MFESVANYFKSKPVEKAWIFGSYAQNKQSTKSDLDILVKFVKPNIIDLFDYAAIKLDLEDLTGLKVDLVEEGQAYQSVNNQIQENKILIYERVSE